MKSLQHVTLGLHLLAPALLALPGCCVGTGTDWGGSASWSEPGPVEPTCTKWDTYDAYWHRCHWGEPGIRWCDAPPGYVETSDAGSTIAAMPEAGSTGVATADAGSTSVGPPDSGGTTTLDAGETSSTDGGTIDGGALASGDSGTSTHASDAGPTISCTVGATCPAGSACVAGSCQACSNGICECQRDDDCPANQICDHTVGSCTEPPPPCTALVTEATCTARADCTPIYGGMSCTNNAGDVCQSGEANCTCATYSFAACVARSP